ncbi:MAG: Tn3 family transposase [Verrucomicrobia bacterium]|nr:Tn3 family transposase [Verrucomicrobiota bacterium]MBV8485223.1 Tn3 family transposase [Verrucomicrobiota bacterium]
MSRSLAYIDEVELRQSDQKALNRGEAYHRFRRAISYVNGAFNFEQTESQINIDALAALYDDPDFWDRAVIEAPGDSLA